ncbi:MAG: DUF4085 family protein [Chloroflexota bacterium]
MMKYFTWHWWMGAGEPSPYDAQDYIHYFSSVRNQLPLTIIDLHDNYTLHDSRLTNFTVDFTKAQVVMYLEGYTPSDRNCSYILTFSEVSQFITLGHRAKLPENRTGGKIWFGDLGYYEVEVMKQGYFEIRMIFATGVEIMIEWGKFSFECL